jgi:Tfp pilus assembly protein PilO
MIIQEREKNILAILSVAIAVVVFLYVLKPSLDESNKLNTEIKSLEAQLKEPKVTREKLQETRDGVDNLIKDIATLKEQLPLSEKRGFLVRDLELLAKENNIEIISFMPKDALAITIAGKEITPSGKSSAKRKAIQLQEQHAMVLKTIINIESRGKFANYNKFFSDIITYYRAVEVSNLTITRSGIAAQMGTDKRFAGNKKASSPLDEAQNTDLNVSFTLLAYTSIPEPNLKSADGFTSIEQDEEMPEIKG